MYIIEWDIDFQIKIERKLCSIAKMFSENIVIEFIFDFTHIFYIIMTTFSFVKMKFEKKTHQTANFLICHMQNE